MDNIVIYTLGFAALIAFIASLLYFVKTMQVMWGYSSLLAIAAIFFSPLIQIGFYFVPKDDLKQRERILFKRYFLSVTALLITGVIASVAIPAIQSNDFNRNAFYENSSNQYRANSNDNSDDELDDYKNDVWLQEQLAEDERLQYQEVSDLTSIDIDAYTNSLQDSTVDYQEEYKPKYYDDNVSVDVAPYTSSLQTSQPRSSYSASAEAEPVNTPVFTPVPMPTQSPPTIVNCDGAGCWDTGGTRYNKGAGETYFPSTGGVCQNIGGQMQCN